MNYYELALAILVVLVLAVALAWHILQILKWFKKEKHRFSVGSGLDENSKQDKNQV